MQAIPAANNVTPRQALQAALPGVSVTYRSDAAAGYTSQNVAIDAQLCQVRGWHWSMREFPCRWINMAHTSLISRCPAG